MPRLKAKKEVVRVDGHLKELTTVTDEKGKVLHKHLGTLMIEFNFRDLLQVILGASILAIPVGFTEETWRLGGQLPMANILVFMALSIGFIGLFTYYHYHRHAKKEHLEHLFIRVINTYFVSFVVVALLLMLIQQAPWMTDPALAFKRVVIVTFPSSLSAAVADRLK